MNTAYDLSQWFHLHDFWLHPSRRSDAAYRVAYIRPIAGREFWWVSNGGSLYGTARWRWLMMPVGSGRNQCSDERIYQPKLSMLMVGHEVLDALLDFQHGKNLMVLELVGGKMVLMEEIT